VKQKVDLNNPNLYNDLLNSLWQMFIQELDHKAILTNLPDSAEECVSLSQGKSCLLTQEAPEYVRSTSFINTKLPIINPPIMNILLPTTTTPFPSCQLVPYN
jgi:hypothetical protein